MIGFLKNPWIIIGLLMVGLVGGAVWYSSEATKQANAGVTILPHIKGGEGAVVTLVEYSDFQCPACGQFQPYIAEILAEHGDKIAFEYKHFPLSQIHRLAEPAAKAAEAAGQQGKFFEFHDLLFANQQTWSVSSNPSQYFIQYASELGLNIEDFTRTQRSSIIANHIRAQFAEARELGFTGTPSFLLNGKKMSFETFDDFRNQILYAIDPNIVLSSPETAVIMDTASGTTAVEGVTNTGNPGIKFGI